MNNDSSSLIAASLREWCAAAAPGSRLPSTRTLVAEHGASPVTVQKALQRLSAEGVVETRPGSGTFVRARRTVRPADYSWQTSALRAPQSSLPPAPTTMRDASITAISLHSGYPALELLPERLVRAALVRAARSDTAFYRSPSAGVPELQSWFAQELSARVPAGVSAPAASDVIVVPGSQSGLISIFRALVGSGQSVLLESPTYWGAILAAAQAGVNVVPVPSGPEGPDPEDLARAFTETGARVFYAQPNFGNPTGGQWSPQRSREILEVVRAHGAFLVEDDWAHDFGITAESSPLAAQDDTGHVIYLRSLTKSVAPAVRVAAVIARGPARERILTDRGSESMYVSGLLQVAALEVVSAPAWRTHLRGVRAQLRERRDLLVASIAEFVPDAHIDHIPRGGLNLWVRLPDHVDVDRVSRECEAQGLFIAGGTEWFPAESAGSYVRLSFAGPNPGAFPEGMRILGRIIAGYAATA